MDATNDDPEGINQLRKYAPPFQTLLVFLFIYEYCVSSTHVAELVGTFNAFDLREKDKINRTMYVDVLYFYCTCFSKLQCVAGKAKRSLRNGEIRSTYRFF